jgi:hypothetical protein
MARNLPAQCGSSQHGARMVHAQPLCVRVTRHCSISARLPISTSSFARAGAGRSKWLLSSQSPKASEQPRPAGLVVPAWRIAIARPSINAWPTRTQSLQVPLPCFNRLRAALPCRTTSLAISRSLQAHPFGRLGCSEPGAPSGDERKCAAAKLTQNG